MTPSNPDSSTPVWKRVIDGLQYRVFAYDFDPQAAAARDRDPRERLACAAAAILAVAFFVIGTWFVVTGRVDNKPTTASTGLIGIHRNISLDPQGWFSDGIWWYQKQTPTPLPFTAIGFLFMAVGYSPQAVMILHAALGSCCVYLLFRVCQRRFGGATALVACLLLLSLPLFLYVTLSGWTFVWAITALLFAIVLLDRYHVSKRIGWYFLGAAAIACAGMSRPENYSVALIAAVFVAAPWRYRPLFVLIAFTYPLLQFLHNNVYLDAPPGLRILNDARAAMPLSQILSEWARDVYRSIGIKSLTPLFLILGGAGVVIFGVPRRRFLTAILLYFFVALAAAYAMRRLSFNHEGYFYAHLILLLPFLAHTIWRCAWIVGAGLQKMSMPPRLAWAGAATVVVALLAWNTYQQRNWLRSRLFFQIRPEIKAARDFLKANAGPDDPIAMDSISETSWLLGELESDTSRDFWFYGSNSKPRPAVNAARRDAPLADIEAMNDWVASGFREWARKHPAGYLLVSSTLEWQEHSTQSKTATQYNMFGLRPALRQEDLGLVLLDDGGGLMRSERVYENERIWIYKFETVPASSYTLLKTGFEDWTDSAPAGWTASPPGSHGVVAADASHGISIVLKPMGDVATSVGQKFRSEEIAPGHLLEIEIEMKADDPHLAVLVVGFGMPAGSAPLNLKPEHPGDGEWHTLSVHTEVPADAVPGICFLSFALRPGASAPALVDNLSIRVLREPDPPPN